MCVQGGDVFDWSLCAYVCCARARVYIVHRVLPGNSVVEVKVLFLTTHTPNCEPFWRSLEVAGHEVRVEQYDDRPNDRHNELVELSWTYGADLAVYIGAYEPSHGRPVPSADVLCRLRDVTPAFIMLCGDAADAPWWPVLEEYHRRECFTRIVAIDGNLNTPISSFKNGLTLLTPLDTRVYRPLFWADRTIKFGMVGGTGHRAGLIKDLTTLGLLDYRAGPVGRSYAEFAQVLCNTKITLNLAQTGTGKYLHVKGRVVEAGFAGSVVMETRGSSLSTWFEPGLDYLEYGDLEDIVSQIYGVADSKLEQIATRYQARMWAEHHPTVFWSKVLSGVV